jgi:hypothetical protein
MMDWTDVWRSRLLMPEISIEEFRRMAEELVDLERRVAPRFPIVCNVRYKVIGRHTRMLGHGNTVNISSRGMLITGGRGLARGMRVEVEVEWPVKLKAGTSLKLVVQGRIVRSEEGRVGLAGLEIVRHEFRTARPESLSTTPRRENLVPAIWPRGRE